MKKKIILATILCALSGTPAYGFDWGLGSKITNNIKNLFSNASKKSAETEAGRYRNKEAETLQEFFNNAKMSGFVTPDGKVDYIRISADPKMAARLDEILNNIQPAAGPIINIEQPVSFHLKPEKVSSTQKLREVIYR
jgi:hypothetical protein